MKIIIILVLINALALKSEVSGIIYSVLNPQDTLIHLGPCYLEDTLTTDIYLGNTGDTDLFMDGQAPSLIIYASPNQTSSLEFTQFDRLYPGMTPGDPFILEAGKDELFGIEYIPSNPLIHPLGINEANIQIALLSVDDASETAKEIFLIRVNKTDKLLAGYDNSVYFDSVYVNPNVPAEYNWKVKSTWVDNIIVTGQNLIAQNTQSAGEINVSEYSYPLEFTDKYREMEWKVSYNPKDIGLDSSLFSLEFKPDSENFPDSTDETSLKIYGFGVKQDIEIADANVDFRNDTLNIGDVIIGKQYSYEAVIENTGNIDIKSLGEVIYKEFDDISYNKSSITKPLFDNLLKTDSIFRIEFDFIPEKYGQFVYRYVIQSDIKNRNISGVPASEEKLTFYIKGRGVSPRLSAATDTLDFRNVILNSIECPSERDTNLRITNNGNMTLRISDIITEPPYPQAKFRTSVNEMILEPGKDTSIVVSFISNDAIIDTYEERLLFVTNQYPPNDSIAVVLQAVTIPPIKANLSLPLNQSAKPGSSLKIPLLIENGEVFPSAFATTFNSDLRYNKTILNYTGYSNFSTASEKAIVDINDEEGELSINLKDNEFFNPSDTLIILNFDIYLGNSTSSNLIFSNPVFGDNNCPKIMDIQVNNGNVMLDSICGLEYKALPFSDESLSFDFINTGRNTGKVNFSIPYKAGVVIESYDIFGNKIFSKHYGELQHGLYEDYIELNDVPEGVYFIRFIFDNYVTDKKILIGM